MVSRYAHQGYGEMFEYMPGDPLPAGDELYVRACDYEKLEVALRKIISDGDYTAPEGMKRIARGALDSTASGSDCVNCQAPIDYCSPERKCCRDCHHGSTTSGEVGK